MLGSRCDGVVTSRWEFCLHFSNGRNLLEFPSHGTGGVRWRVDEKDPWKKKSNDLSWECTVGILCSGSSSGGDKDKVHLHPTLSRNAGMLWVGKGLESHSCLIHGQGHLPLFQVAPSSVQPNLEHFQGWGSQNLSGIPKAVSSYILIYF